MANTNPHPLPRFRGNGPLSNMAEFAKAFGCKKGDSDGPRAGLQNLVSSHGASDDKTQLGFLSADSGALLALTLIPALARRVGKVEILPLGKCRG